MVAKVYFDDPRLLLLFEASEHVGFPIAFHATVVGSDDYGLLDEIGFPRFEKVLGMFPNLIFFGHSQSFWSEISGEVTMKDKSGYPEGSVTPGGAVPRLMRKFPQLYGDLSAGSGLNLLRRDLEHTWKFIEEFQDRLVLGLDFVAPDNDRPHVEWFKKSLDDGNISQQAYEKIMWKNIAGVLKLDI